MVHPKGAEEMHVSMEEAVHRTYQTLQKAGWRGLIEVISLHTPCTICKMFRIKKKWDHNGYHRSSSCSKVYTPLYLNNQILKIPTKSRLQHCGKVQRGGYLCKVLDAC